jgi:queuine tRNA-ribosyltransferase
LGIGDIDDLFEVVNRGIDLFDCVAPTRMARTGTVFAKGANRHRIHIFNARFKEDQRPIDSACRCPACRHYSRAYLRHLFIAKELLGIRLATIHNVWFFESLMDQIRRAIREGRLEEVQRTWCT